MRILVLFVWLVAACLAFCPDVVMAQETVAGADAGSRVQPEWRLGFMTLGADVAVHSAYVWRGFVLHEGACVQPDVWVSAGPVTVTSWLNVRGNVGPHMRLNEHDLIADVSQTLGSATLSAGWINYTFLENDGGRTNEFYLGASFAWPLNPGVQIAHDVGQGSGSYVTLSAGHDVALARSRVVASPRVSLGYNHRQWTDTSGFSDLNVGLQLAIPIPSARIEVQPSIHYSRSLERGVFPNKLYGGVSVSFK